MVDHTYLTPAPFYHQIIPIFGNNFEISVFPEKFLRPP